MFYHGPGQAFPDQPSGDWEASDRACTGRSRRGAQGWTRTSLSSQSDAPASGSYLACALRAILAGKIIGPQSSRRRPSVGEVHDQIRSAFHSLRERGFPMQIDEPPENALPEQAVIATSDTAVKPRQSSWSVLR